MVLKAFLNYADWNAFGVTLVLKVDIHLQLVAEASSEKSKRIEITMFFSIFYDVFLYFGTVIQTKFSLFDSRS